MAPHRANVSVISVYVSKSASRNAPRVSSENTTPHPNVASGGFRSKTVIPCDGSAFFMRSAKYRPAGPAPTTATLTPSPRPSREHVREALHLGDVGHGREQHQLVAARFGIASDELLHRLG